MSKDFLQSMKKKDLSMLIPTGDIPAEVLPVSEPPPTGTIDPIVEQAVEGAPGKLKMVEHGPESTKTETTTAKYKSVSAAKNTASPLRVITLRATEKNIGAVNAIAYWERRKIQDIWNEAVEAYIKKIPKQTLTDAQGAYQESLNR